MLELCLFQKNEPKMETKNKFKSTIWDTFFWRNVWCQNYSKPNLQESSIFPVWHTLGVSTLPVKMFGLGQKMLSRLAWSKGLVQLLPRLYSGWGFLPSQWDRQHMLLFWFREASQNLSLFRQLFFHSFQGKMLKNQCIVMAIFQHFSFGPPLETMKKTLSK